MPGLLPDSPHEFRFYPLVRISRDCRFQKLQKKATRDATFFRRQKPHHSLQNRTEFREIVLQNHILARARKLPVRVCFQGFPNHLTRHKPFVFYIHDYPFVQIDLELTQILGPPIERHGPNHLQPVCTILLGHFFTIVIDFRDFGRRLAGNGIYTVADDFELFGKWDEGFCRLEYDYRVLPTPKDARAQKDVDFVNEVTFIDCFVHFEVFSRASSRDHIVGIESDCHAVAEFGARLEGCGPTRDVVEGNFVFGRWGDELLQEGTFREEWKLQRKEEKEEKGICGSKTLSNKSTSAGRNEIKQNSKFSMSYNRQGKY
ncbi:SIN3-like 5 [Striga asiatica]|uniref:SIN3-like 5 n=1 Tax=Striga asiatica TaxID=4170 RepID=A0A5A7QA51_STRAF|nr:SIN3-like 5 [Striga asiatica]